MNIDSLKCFVLVAESLSFARAAEAMYKSQPAVTKQIRSLEEELGVALFTRSTRHVELTPAGMSFYKDAKDIILNSQMAIDRAKRQNTGEHSLSIGLSNPTALFHLSPILSALREECPEIHPNIQVLGYKLILNLFTENKLDVLFYYKENMPLKTGANFKEIRQDSFVCLLPAGHRFEAKESLSIQDLKDEPIIVCNPLNAPLSTASFQQQLLDCHSPHNVLYCDSVEIAHCMVESGLGATILPGMLCLKASGFSTVPIEDKAQMSFGVFYHKQRTNPLLKKLLKLISNKSAEYASI